MKRSVIVSAGMVALGALVLAGCSGEQSSGPANTSSPAAGVDMVAQQPAASGEIDALEWAYYAVLPTLDPARSMSREAGQIIGNLCDTVLRTEPDLTTADNLASLTRVSDTEYELALVEGATFWDGTPVTAEDVVYSLTRHMDPAVGSDFAEFYTNVAAIEATDATTVGVTMSQPDILFEKALGTMGGAVMQKAFSEAAGESLGSLQGDLMCSGPFRIASSDPSAKIVLERNDEYWREDTKPLAATVTINYLQDGSIAAAALQSGDVSGMYSFPSVSMDQLTSAGVGEAYPGLSNSTFSFVVGGLDGNPLEDVRLRTALSLAIDREAISQRIFPNGGAPATSFLGAAARADVDHTASLNATADVEAAKALVEEALGSDGQSRPIKLSYTSGVGAEVGQMALYLEQVATSIGLEIELDDKAPMDWVQGVMSATTDPSFDLTFNYSSNAVNDAYASFLRVLPGSVDNYSGYDNADVTAKIAEGRSTLDAAERGKIAGEIEAQVLEDLPIIPVSWVPRQVFVNGEVGGAALSDATYMGYPWAATIGKK